MKKAPDAISLATFREKKKKHTELLQSLCSMGKLKKKKNRYLKSTETDHLRQNNIDIDINPTSLFSTSPVTDLE